MTFKIQKAQRKKVPLLISIAGLSGSGKTYSALLMAAGIAGKDGKVGLLDTENGRGSMYADSPGIKAALPQGYDIAEMKAPFAPARYSEALESFQSHGCDVLVIDSATHEWEGHGGCSDIAENNKLRGMPNWAKAKMEHKRWMNHLLASNMHIILCFRARDKVKVENDANGKPQVVPIGLQPIAEKNMPYEMTLSLMLDEKTHRPEIIKCPEPLKPLFTGNEALVTKDMGLKLRQWADGGAESSDDSSDLFLQAEDYANQGTEAYREYFTTLTSDQQKALLPKHEQYKKIAAGIDKANRAEHEPSLTD